MTSCPPTRFRPRRLRRSTLALGIALLATGCASRSLNTPSVVDWSSGAQPTVPSVTSTTPTPPSQQLYTVKRDDTLASIAKRFNTTPAEIANWNNLGPGPRVKPDQVIKVSPPVPAGVQDSGAVATSQPIGSGTVDQRPLGGSPDAPSAAVVPSSAPLKTGPLGVRRPYSDATFAELSKQDGDAPAVAAPSAGTVLAPSVASTPAAATSWAWPVAGKPASGFADGKTKGIDIAGKAGDPVMAAADGKVTFAGTGVRGYGNFVIVRHTPELLSVYAHNRANLVKEGAVVAKGQKIAEMGNSDTDSVKLHFEIRNDSKPVDPLKYLPER